MKSLIILTDYKNYFGSKQKSQYYNSGFDLNSLTDLFNKKSYSVKIYPLSTIDFSVCNFKDSFVLYTSSEDHELYYKQFIEDVLLGIQINGGILIPDFIYFRAHNNKVFMEILRKILLNRAIKYLPSRTLGTLEELNYIKERIVYPIVYKSSAGSKSRGVGLAHSYSELVKKCHKISKTFHFWYDFKELVRKYKYSGYITNSKHRRKFILQEFIDGLDHDYKILVFDKKYYILKRKTKSNDFRASGQGLLEYTDNLPEGIFDFAENIYQTLDVPFISLDIAYNGIEYYLLEFQVIYFGTYTLEYSECFYLKYGNQWLKVVEKSVLENVYVDAIDSFINRKFYT